jgi:hypothetical protein
VKFPSGAREIFVELYNPVIEHSEIYGIWLEIRKRIDLNTIFVELYPVELLKFVVVTIANMKKIQKQLNLLVINFIITPFS